MINYPNKKKTYETVKQSVRNVANQGMALEEMINKTNAYYRLHEIALIAKRPTPVKVIKTNEFKHIVDGFFLEPSSLDYVGIYNGYYLDFEAKETTSKKGFPFQNISIHQIEAMKEIIKHHGYCFAIIFLKAYNEIYFIDGKDMVFYYENGSSYLTYETIKEVGTLIKEGYLAPIDYLKVVKEKYNL